MSIRTLIEINHDYTHNIAVGREDFLMFLGRWLRGGDTESRAELQDMFGARIVSQRHHADQYYIRENADGFQELFTTLREAGEAIRELRLADGHAARTGDESRFDRALNQVCQHENRIKILLARASVDRSPKGQDAEERLDRNDESAVPKADAQKEQQ